MQNLSNFECKGWSFNPKLGVGFQEDKMQSRLVILLFGILLSLTLAESLTVESRKRKEISCYPLAKVKFRTAGCSLCWYVIRSRNNLDHEGSWRYVKWEESPEWHQRQWNRVWVDESTGHPGVLCCAVLTSCQKISAHWFSAWLRGPWAHRALLAVRPELYAWLDTLTIVKNAAKVQLYAFCSLHFQTISASNRHS